MAPGIHRIEDSFTNWYLIEEAGRLTVVDTGVPSSWDSLHAVLIRLGRTARDIEAVVLTDAHFDHLSFAERARRVLHVPVYVHEAPGHTHGHCALHLPFRDVIIAGDAVVTLDPYTARRGPRIVAGAATVDTQRNLAALDAISDAGAGTVLVGHGDPWRAGAPALVAQARAAGAA